MLWLKRLAVCLTVLVLCTAPFQIAFDTGTQRIGFETLQAQAAGPLVLIPLALGALGFAGTTFGQDFATNMLYKVAIFIFGGILQITASLLSIAGLAFDWSLYAFAVNFGGTLEALGIDSAVKIIWKSFKDLSNIVIIGSFVFIAINIILGNHHYGQKQFAVRAIIIALLVNFSLFFSMALIDVSNFVAYQFYRGIARTGGNSSVGINTSSLEAQANVSRRIATSFGLGTLSDNTAVVNRIMNDPKGGIHQALIFMLGVSIIFLFAAYVFFFAAYMLVVRGIKLIIVMAVSSLAVACYIVPHHFEKYFTEWKDNLIHSALFAPILLIMLWAVIAIMDVMALRTSFQGIPAEGILKPEEGYFIASVLRYIVMAGLLMAAVKTAEKMAKQGNNLFGYSMWGAEGGIMTGKMLGVSPISGTRTLLRNRAASSLMSQREAADQEFKNAKTEDGRNAARKKLEKIQGRIDSGGLASGKIEKALGMLQKSMSGIKTKDTSVKDIIKKRDDEAKKKKENETADGKHLTTVGQAAVKESEHQDKDRQEAFKAHQEATDKLTGAISDLGNKIEEKNQKLKIDSDSVKAMQKDVDSYNAKIGPPTNTEKREMEQRVAEIAGKTKGIEKLRDEINADNAKLKSQNAQLLEHENRKEDRALQAIEDGKLRRKKEEEIRTAQKSGAVSRAWNVVNQIAPNMSQEGKEALHKRIMSTPEALAQQDREEKISTHLESITKKVDAVAEAPKAAAHTADAAHPPTTASSGGGHEPPAGAPKAH